MFQTKTIGIFYLAISLLLVNVIVAAAQPEYEITMWTEAIAETIAEQAIIGEGRPYTLGIEDVLEIIVQNQPEFSGRYVIGPDGKIQYSFVGDIKAEGLTKAELKQAFVYILILLQVALIGLRVLLPIIRRPLAYGYIKGQKGKFYYGYEKKRLRFI
jgi:hypothetical protein